MMAVAEMAEAMWMVLPAVTVKVLEVQMPGQRVCSETVALTEVLQAVLLTWVAMQAAMAPAEEASMVMWVAAVAAMGPEPWLTLRMSRWRSFHP